MKRNKIAWSVFITILAIIISGFLFLAQYTDRIIDPYVRALLEETLPLGHHIEYENIRVNLLAGNISVQKVKMYPGDSLGVNKIQYNLNVTAIELTDFELWEVLLLKSLTIKDVIIDHPHVTVTLPAKTLDALNEVKERQAPKDKEQLLKNIFLDKIIISEGDFKLLRSDTLLASSSNINFLAQSINLIKNSKDEPIGYSYDDVNLSISDIDLYPQSGLYSMKLGKFEAHKKDSTLIFRDFKMIPKANKVEFSKHLKYQNDRFDLTVGKIEIADIGLERWLNGEALQISKVEIDNLYADIYRDKNVTANPDLYPLFYNESFLKLEFPLSVDTLSITNSKLFYNELSVDHDVAGSMLLDDFNIQSYSLTNQVDNDTIDNFMHLIVQAKIMSQGQLNAELILPLQGDLHSFNCFGSVGTMELSPLNDMLEPAINMTFNGGSLDGLTFDFTANDKVSSGWMEFLFSDLDVALLKKEDNKQWGFASFLANTVAMSNNPVEGKDIKTVKIGYDRNKNKGIVNYIWKTLQSGLVRTIIPTNKFTITSKKKKKNQGKKSK